MQSPELALHFRLLDQYVHAPPTINAAQRATKCSQGEPMKRAFESATAKAPAWNMTFMKCYR